MAALLENTLLPERHDGEGDSVITTLLDILTSDDETQLVGAHGTIVLTAELRNVLLTVARALASGSAVTVEPRRTVLTTQEAADLLGITRPTLVRLLEAEQIPYTTPGRHRRVELADVLTYRQRLRDDRAEALTELGRRAADGTDMGFVRTR